MATRSAASGESSISVCDTGGSDWAKTMTAGTTRPISVASWSGPLHDATEIGRVVPTVMLFAQSDPPVSHTPVEDSPEEALRIAIDAYGRTVGEALSLVAAGPLEVAAR